MDGSDDYVFDDIVFDEQALAVLDQEEQKYLQSSLQAGQPTIASEEPVNKRQKTNTGWSSGIGASTSSGDTYDDLPDISIRGDGSYGVGVHGIRTNNLADGIIVPRAPKQVDSVRETSFTSNYNRVHSPHASSRNSTTAQASSSRHSNIRLAHPVNSGPSGYSRLQEKHIPAQESGNSVQLQNQMLALQKKLDEVGI